MTERINMIGERLEQRWGGCYEDPSRRQCEIIHESYRVAQKDKEIHFSSASRLCCPFENAMQVNRLSAKKGFLESYYISFQIPITMITRRYALTMGVISEWYSHNWRDLQFRFRLRNIIPYDANIVGACLSGNLAQVKSIILRGEASPDDVTPDLRPLLWVSGKETPSYCMNRN